MNKLLKGIASLSLVTLLAACGNGSSDGEVQSAMEKDTIVMGLDDTFAPMGFRDDNGEIVGFDIDLANEVAERIDKDIEFQSIDWALKETELDAGNIDLIWNGYTVTPEREEQVLFSEPYLETTQLIITTNDSGIETKADLSGKVVAAQQSSSAIDAIEADESQIHTEFANGEIVQYPSNNDVFNDLISGRADAIVVDEVLARYYMKQNPDFDYKVLEDSFGSETYAVGMRQDDTQMKEALDGALNDMKEDGTYDEISNKWFDNEN